MDRQLNDDGWVAIKHTHLVPKHIMGGEGREYIFAIRANIPMSWVHPDDVDKILNILGGCCGQKTSKVFFLANESDVRRWTNNGGA